MTDAKNYYEQIFNNPNIKNENELAKKIYDEFIINGLFFNWDDKDNTYNNIINFITLLNQYREKIAHSSDSDESPCPCDDCGKIHPFSECEYDKTDDDDDEK